MFFLGLSLGSTAFGRIGERLRRPLLAFAAVEMGVAALALLTPAAFEAAEPVFQAMYRASAPDAAWLFATATAWAAPHHYSGSPSRTAGRPSKVPREPP